MSIKASKDTASALVATSNGISVRSFFALPHHSPVLGSLPASYSHPDVFESKTNPHFVSNLSRKAGIRAALQSPQSSATTWRKMTTIAPFAVKTSNLGAFKSIMGSIPRPYQNNPPFGSILSSFLAADSGVCLDTCRSGYHGMHVLGA